MVLGFGNCGTGDCMQPPGNVAYYPFVTRLGSSCERQLQAEKRMAKSQNNTRGACGEHYVASYLSGMGLVVGITKTGAPATDLIVTSESGARSVSIQVKTGGPHSHITQKKKPENNAWCWRTSKAKRPASDSHWYAFVFVGDWPSDGSIPEVFFVPSKVVAQKAQDPGISEGWFWISEAEAEPYRGARGYRPMASCLK